MPTLITLTGVPGTGKSTLANGLVANYGDNEATKFFNDYWGHMIEWIEKYGIEAKLAQRRDGTFFLEEKAYKLISTYVAEKMGEEARRFFEEGGKVAVLECARGAWGQDNYRDHWFAPLLEEVGKVKGLQIANFEIVADLEILEQRNKWREEHENGSPPADIYTRYLGEDGQPNCSSCEQLNELKWGEMVRVNREVTSVGWAGENEEIKFETLKQVLVELNRLGLEGKEGSLTAGKEW